MESTPLKRGKQNTNNITKIYINTIYIQYSKKRERSEEGGGENKEDKEKRAKRAQWSKRAAAGATGAGAGAAENVSNFDQPTSENVFFVFVFVIPRDESDERRSSKRVCIWSIVGRPLCLPYPQWDPGPVDSVWCSCEESLHSGVAHRPTCDCDAVPRPARRR